MDPRMMNQWLAAQSQKKQVTEASMQRKRLGIKEGVNYGDINFRAPIDPTSGQPYFVDADRNVALDPRSPESAANLTRRLETLYKAVGDTENVDRQHRIASMMLSKGVAPERTGIPDGIDTSNTNQRLVAAIKAEEPVSAGQLSIKQRKAFDETQVEMSRIQRERTLAAKRAAANRIGGSKLPKALGAAGAVLALATGAQAADVVHGLNPLSVLDSGSLGTDDMMGEPIEFKEPAPKQQKPLPGAQYMYPAKMNENNMMKQWLKAQTQKQLWF
jgi:hypothetical protein